MMTHENLTRDVGATNVRDGESVVDAWVRLDLLRKYGTLLFEPIPRELFALLPRH